MIPGLFGKMPAHGDFVRRGFDDATVTALDAWIAAGPERVRERCADDDHYADWLRAAPPWRFWAPPGWMGECAVHGALAPSVDRVGRYFALVVGVAGDVGATLAAAVAAPQWADAAEALIYRALGEGMHADALHAALGDTPPDAPVMSAALACAIAPGTALFWTAGEPPEVRSATDATPALFGRLLGSN